MVVEKERVKALEWFVELTNIDLDKLSPGDRAKFLVECEEYLFTTGLRGDKRAYIDQEVVLPAPKVRQLFGPSDSPVFWRNIKKLQIILRKEIKNFLPVKDIEDPSLAANFFIFRWRGELDIIFNRRRKSPNSLLFVPLAGNHRDFVFIKFFILLQGLPPSAIKKCLECKKYFVNPTWKEKQFCSPKCMWRFNATEWRKELKKNPKKHQAYLKKQREIMNKRYEEKQKALGLKKVIHHKKREEKEN